MPNQTHPKPLAPPTEAAIEDIEIHLLLEAIRRRRGFDFLVKWLPEKHPERCHE